jgi:prophage antirepressor-like protein
MSKHFDLETFTFNGHTLRTAVIDGTIWFAVADVFASLGRANNPVGDIKAILDLDEEYKVVTRSLVRAEEVPLLFPRISGRGGSSRVAFVTESGLMKYILRAQRSNPAAKDFQDWITKVVIPSIRKDGGGDYDAAPSRTNYDTALDGAPGYIPYTSYLEVPPRSPLGSPHSGPRPRLPLSHLPTAPCMGLSEGDAPRNLHPAVHPQSPFLISFDIP